MEKRDFFGYISVLTGVITIMMLFCGIFDVKHLFTYGWVIDPILIPFAVTLGAIALIKLFWSTQSSLFHRILSILILLIGIYIASTLGLLVITSFKEWPWAHQIVNFVLRLYKHKDRGLMTVAKSYYLLIELSGIGFLVKKKWLFGVCLLAIPLPFLLPHYEILFRDCIWSVVFSIILSSCGWFVIAFCLYKEDTDRSQSNRLAAA